MPDRYADLSAKEADHLMTGIISAIVCAELAAARAMTVEEWEERDIYRWSDGVAGAIYCAVQNRRMGAE